MKYIYEVIDWVSNVRKDTFTRWEELRNVDLKKSYIIVFKGEHPNIEDHRITSEDALDAWITARERDQWVPTPHEKWDPFKDTDVVMKENHDSTLITRFKHIAAHMPGVLTCDDGTKWHPAEILLLIQIIERK